ncbi:MAG: TIM44-like domain-containing protein [Myxococcaceae bacterium]
MRRLLHRLSPYLPFLALFIASVALARGGGGENYSSGSSSSGSSSGGGGGGGDIGGLIEIVLWLVVVHPKVGCPLLVMLGIGAYFYSRANNPTLNTQKALQRYEGEAATQVDPRAVDGFVNALKLKDPSFDKEALLGRAKMLFVGLQDAWMKGDMTPMRPFLSDATFQRFVTQLQLMKRNGVRDAITDLRVLETSLIGLDQTEGFDTVQIKFRAELRDTDVAADKSYAEAIAAAKSSKLEEFIEVWSLVRKPGAKTKLGEDATQGKCPNCGAPFKGGAANNCEFCGAIVNSGNYDWVLAEITQASEHVRGYALVDGLLEMREADPAFNIQVLEDRSSLVFWKWVDALSMAEPGRLSKLASSDFTTALAREVEDIKKTHRRRVFVECAVGGVNTRLVRRGADGMDQAHVEIRWSSKMGLIGLAEKPSTNLPMLPQRSIFIFVRKGTAKTNAATGMATNRCPNCAAPLTDTVSPTCDFCGAQLQDGEKDWVLKSALSYEAWDAQEGRAYQAATAAQRTARAGNTGAAAAPVAAAIPKNLEAYKHGDGNVMDQQERERLLFMMAAMAAADGNVDSKERELLRLCSERWSVPWEKVEMAINAGDKLFERLVPKGSPEAESFMKRLVEMALVDGKIDRKERKLLESASWHLGIGTDRLKRLLAGQP